MTTSPVDPEGQTFRYVPGFLATSVGCELFVLYGAYIILADVNKLGYWYWVTPKGLLILAIYFLGNVVVFKLIQTLWRGYWRFTFTPTHLIAVHRLRRQRVKVPWGAIIIVRKLPREWWARGGGLGVSQIETSDGLRIPFMTTLMIRYEQFLEELKARAINCRSFEAYRSEWE